MKITTEKALRQAIDQIGFVQELTDQLTKPLRDDVKLAMGDRKLDGIGTDVFDAKLFAIPRSEIDAGAFFRLYKRGKITESQLISCLSIKKDPAREFMSEQDLRAISEAKPASPALVIKRVKTVDVTLVQAVRAISEAVEDANRDA